MKLRFIDLVVIVLIVCVLAAILLPVVQQAREAARRTQSKNNLKAIGLAFFNYESTYNCFPAGGYFDDSGRGYAGWMTSIVSFIEQGTPFPAPDFRETWDSPVNAGKLMIGIACYQIPGENSQIGHWEFNLAHYSANAYLLGANSSIRWKDIDSKEQTFLAAELGGDFVPWGCPYNFRPLTDLNAKPPTYGRYSKDGGLFLFADGHVEFVSNEGFPALRDSLRGPDLAGFGEMPANIVRPNIFIVPKSAIQPSSIHLSGAQSFADGEKNYDGNFVSLVTYGGKSKSGTDVHDADIAALGRHSKLEKLVLIGDFTNQSLPKLQKLTELRTLEMNSDLISEAGLSFVDQLPKLRMLTVGGAQITKEVLQRLQARLPECHVGRSNH